MKDKEEYLLKLQVILKQASKEDFVIALTHRPLNCMDTKDREECFISSWIQNEIEDIFLDNNVRVMLSGHIHQYF